MPDVPTMSQAMMVIIGLLATGFTGLALFILKGILDNLVSIREVQKDFEKTVTDILVKMSMMQEQIKTLFMNDSDHHANIQRITTHMQRRGSK